MVGTQMLSYNFPIFMHIFQILCASDSNYQHLRHSLQVVPKTIDMFPPMCRAPEFLGAPIPLADDWWLCKNESSTYLLGVGADSKVQYTQGYSFCGTLPEIAPLSGFFTFCLILTISLPVLPGIPFFLELESF